MLQLIVLWSLFVALTIGCVVFAWRRNRPALKALLTFWSLLMRLMLWSMIIGQGHRDARKQYQETLEYQDAQPIGEPPSSD
ncbi:MAG: hypothetical protein AB8C95_05370 [Phycisphaeraceae bacterium]